MRINELKKPHEITAFRHLMKKQGSIAGWRDVVNEFMNKHGFKNVGSGVYASVFVSDNYPFALKVFKKESGYITWLKFCKANQNNPFIPKIRGNLVKIHDKIYAVRMEILKPIKLREMPELIIGNELNSLFYKHYLTQKSKIKHLEPTGNKHIDSIVDVFRQNVGMIDMHTDNMMKRDDDQIVIIDPFSEKDLKFMSGPTRQLSHDDMRESAAALLLKEKHYRGPLYHATDLYSASNIFSSGLLRLNMNYIPDDDKKHNVKGNKFKYYLSTSRSKTGSYHYQRYRDSIGRGFMLNKNTVLVIDPSKIANDKRFYISSIDYFSSGENKKTGYSEAEERIFSNEKMVRIGDMISEVHILNDLWPNTPHHESKRDYEPQINKQIEEVIRGAQKNNIKVYVYDMEDRNAFITLNKHNADWVA